MASLLSTHPGLLVWVVIFVIAALVCTVIGTIMRRSGSSLRPLKWFAGLVLVIGAPQFFAHL